MTNEEKNNILDQHKEVYDGYLTSYIKPSNEQPLYTQDFANDKQGLTVNNKGVVTAYKNMNINEMKHDNKSTGLFSDEEEEYNEGYISAGTEYAPEESFEEVEEQLDMIGDGEYDLPNGTVDVDDEMCEEDDFELNLDDLMDLGDEENEIEEEEQEEIINKINESLDMFKRLKNYN
jgi:rubrerythrin